MEWKNSEHRKWTAAETVRRGEKVVNFEGKGERIETEPDSYQGVEEIDSASGFREHKEATTESIGGHEGI